MALAGAFLLTVGTSVFYIDIAANFDSTSSSTIVVISA